jgi:hypothetical protein
LLALGMFRGICACPYKVFRSNQHGSELQLLKQWGQCHFFWSTFCLCSSDICDTFFPQCPQVTGPAHSVSGASQGMAATLPLVPCCPGDYWHN